LKKEVRRKRRDAREMAATRTEERAEGDEGTATGSSWPSPVSIT
jgi:hypothetical protein